MDPTPKPLSTGPLPVVLRGSCLCGTVRLESKMLPESITLCHCVECRKASSNPFLAFGLFHNDYIQWSIASSSGTKPLHGDLSEGIKLTYYSDIAVRGWCHRCGTPLFMKYHCRPDGTSITMGLVDDRNVVGQMPKIKEHIFLDEKVAWWDIPSDDGTSRHEGFNEYFTRRLKDWSAKGRPQRLDIPPPPFKFKL
ncbi:Mss4-like protein [Annulohypoxylon moriforme]|nr:Mss4-like protein [Annulohypoxylon moriforme]